MRLILDYFPSSKRLTLSVKRDMRFDWSYDALTCSRSEADRIFCVVESLYRHAPTPQDVFDFES